jgi:hypothetical protein
MTSNSKIHRKLVFPFIRVFLVSKGGKEGKGRKGRKNGGKVEKNEGLNTSVCACVFSFACSIYQRPKRVYAWAHGSERS